MDNNQCCIRRLFTALFFLSFVITLHGCTQNSLLSDNSPSEPVDVQFYAATPELMDIAALTEYLKLRHAKLAASLAHSKLNTEQQELVANAMNKVCAGIPMSSFTRSLHQSDDRGGFNIDTSDWSIEETGWSSSHEVSTNNIALMSFPNRRWTSPFVNFSSVPFVSETGQLVEESKSSATFIFDFIPPDTTQFRNLSISSFHKKLEETMTITIRLAKDFQVPEYIELKLKKPFRKLFAYSVNTYTTKFQFSYVPSCGCFAVNSSDRVMSGSVRSPRVRLTFRSWVAAFTNIKCEQPMQSLVLDTEKSRQIDFR